MSDEQFSGPWLPWYHGDFLRATQGWTVTERGVYFLLLGASWEVGPLPEDRRRLAGIVGAQLDEFDEAWKTVSAKFITTKKGLVNRRLELHRDKQALRSQKARESVMTRYKKPTDKTTNEDTSVTTNEDTNEDTSVLLDGLRSGVRSGVRNSYVSATPQISDLRSEKSSEHKAQNGERAHRATRAAPTRIPDDFSLTEERRRYATDRGLDADRTFELFVTYWRGKGSNATKANWDATWQHWCAKDAAKLVERDRPRKSSFKQTQERLNALAAEADDDDGTELDAVLNGSARR